MPIDVVFMSPQELHAQFNSTLLRSGLMGVATAMVVPMLAGFTAAGGRAAWRACWPWAMVVGLVVTAGDMGVNVYRVYTQFSRLRVEPQGWVLTYVGPYARDVVVRLDDVDKVVSGDASSRSRPMKRMQGCHIRLWLKQGESRSSAPRPDAPLGACQQLRDQLNAQLVQRGAA